MKVRVCVIGNGNFAGSVHYPSLLSFNEVEIVGVVAFNKERLINTAQRFGIPENCIFPVSSVTGYQSVLLQLKPDAVYAIGAPEQMFDVWVWCLENRFNLYIEKPMGLTLHQAEILAGLAEANHCITQVSLQRRNMPLLHKMKEECNKKGAITHALVEFNKCEMIPMKSARDRMHDDFIHCIDTARWLMEGEVIRTESYCRRIGVGDINWISTHLYFDNGNTCHAIANWSSGRRIFRVVMHAPGICAEAEPEAEGRVYADGDTKGICYSTADVAGSDELFIYGGFREKNREFIQSILKGKEITSSPFRDALKTMKICETILAQAILR
jgi:predicted dehydrogenase